MAWGLAHVLSTCVWQKWRSWQSGREGTTAGSTWKLLEGNVVGFAAQGHIAVGHTQTSDLIGYATLEAVEESSVLPKPWCRSYILDIDRHSPEQDNGLVLTIPVVQKIA